MKKHRGMFVTVLALAGIIFSGVASAQVAGQSESSRFDRCGRKGFGHHHTRHPGHLLARALHRNTALEVLTEMTGKDAEAVKADLQTQRMREVLESYGIDREAFHAAMDAKVTDQVNKVASCGLITEEQASEILEAMQKDPEAACTGDRR